MHHVKLIKAIWEFSSGNKIYFSYAGNHLPPGSSIFWGKLTHHNKSLCTWSIDCKLSGYSLLCCLFFFFYKQKWHMMGESDECWLRCTCHCRKAHLYGANQNFIWKRTIYPMYLSVNMCISALKPFLFLNSYFLLFAGKKTCSQV